MLFLLNKMIVEIETPEVHLARNWKRIGCGEPERLVASDAVNYAIMVMNSHLSEGLAIEADTAEDLAALLIAKTGANAALFTGDNGAKLNALPEVVLEGLREALPPLATDKAQAIWDSAA